MTSEPTTQNPTGSDPAEEILDAQRHVWTIGDYPTIAEHLLPVSADLVEGLAVEPGQRVLDVGTGTGNTALEAARRGAHVTGIDLTPAQIEKAGRRARELGLDLDLRIGNAERLDLPDSSFDVVVSVFGVIFAPDHRRAAAELARVCRPGGTVAITAWVRDGGWFAVWREHAAHLLPPSPPGAPEPDAWGDPDEAARRLAAAGLDPAVETRPFHWAFPSAEAAADVFFSAAGPFVAFLEGATTRGQADEARASVAAAIDEANQADDGTLLLPAPYLVATGHR